MKILFFTSSLNAGGRERQLVEFLKGLYNYKGITFELVVMSHKIHYSTIKKLNIKIHYLIRNSKKDPRILKHLYKICKEFKPDIIHTWDSMASVYAMPIVKLMNLIFINGMIRDAPPNLKPLSKPWIRSKLTFPFSDVIVANSNAGIKAYHTPINKGVCIHNGFDIQRAKKCLDIKIIKNKLDIHTNIVIGMVASFTIRKDYKTYILSSLMILRKYPDITFLAIGNGKNLEKYKNMVEPKYRKNFIFLSNQKDIESIINIFDIGILATDNRFHGEGISNSIMEYMALKKPVIATDTGGNNEIVINKKTGFLVKPLDANDMYSKMLKILENKYLATKMGCAGKESIIKNFSLEKMILSYIHLYKNLLSNQRRIIR